MGFTIEGFKKLRGHVARSIRIDMWICRCGCGNDTRHSKCTYCGKTQPMEKENAAPHV